MADVSVRPARPDEAGEIARIQRDTLAMAYESVMSAQMLAQLVDPAVQQAILAGVTEQIRSTRGDARVLVALEGERLVGLALAQTAVRDGVSILPDGDRDPERTGVLEQILVEPRWGRRGHGSRLLAAAVDFFTESGFVRAVTWVPETNLATTSLLETAGWARDGYARGLDAGAGVVLREIRFHTSLDPAE